MILLASCSTTTPTVARNTPTNTITPITQVQTSKPGLTSTASPIPAGPTLTPTFDFSMKLTLLAPIASPTRHPTPTQFIETYPLKQVWIQFGLGGQCCSVVSGLEPLFNYPLPTFVIYTDYQMILYHDGYPILEKKVSNEEICNLVSSMNWLGLTQINSKGTLKDDPIYLDQARSMWGPDGAFYELTINGEPSTHLSVYQMVSDYVIEPVKNILKFLGQYSPSAMALYHPDRLVIAPWERDGLEDITAIPWPSDFPSLKENADSIIYIDGDQASTVYDYLQKNPGNIYIDLGVKFVVISRPILPHEIRGNLWGYFMTSTPAFIPPINCP
jgi:hypothetical protein